VAEDLERLLQAGDLVLGLLQVLLERTRSSSVDAALAIFGRAFVICFSALKGSLSSSTSSFSSDTTAMNYLLGMVLLTTSSLSTYPCLRSDKRLIRAVSSAERMGRAAPT